MTSLAPPPSTARLTPTSAIRAVADHELLEKRSRLFDKLVSIGSRSRECLREIVSLARRSDYEALAAQLEQHVREIPADTTTDEIRAKVEEPLRGICRMISDSNLLCNVFKEAPSLAGYAARDVATLAAIADLRPHPELMLESSDGPFMRVVRQSMTPGGASQQRIIFEDFQKLIAIGAVRPATLESLWQVAGEDNDSWFTQIALLERALLTGRVEAGMTQATLATFDTICGPAVDAQTTTRLTELLRRPPLLSEILPEEVRALRSVYAALPDATALLASPAYSGSNAASEEEKQRTLAKYAFDEIAKNQSTLDDLFARLELRRWVANRCLGLRAFAKLNALERQWPELSRMLRQDYATLQALERAAMNPASIAPEHRAVWQRYEGDEQLRKFLVVKPLVTDINLNDIRTYFSASQSMQVAASTPSSGDVGGLAAVPAPSRDRTEYLEVLLMLQTKTATADGASASVNVTLSTSGDVQLVEAVEVDLNNLPGTAILSGVKRDALAPESRAFSSSREYSPDRSAEVALTDAQLREIGVQMSELAFPGRIGEAVRALYGREENYRVLRAVEGLPELPWETLHLARERVSLGLTQRFSLVRFQPMPTPTAIRQIGRPVRMLAVLSNPSDTPPLNLEAERAALEDALGPAQSDGLVSLEFLISKDATIDQLQRSVRRVRPHILHFAGHGVFEGKEGAIVLHTSSGRTDLLKADSVATLLRDYGVALAILNSCDTGTSLQNDAVTSVAGALVRAGVPAAIATLRVIADEGAVLFTSALYRAFVEGYALESALVEARKRLNAGGWDWSAYGLFANTNKLTGLSFRENVSVRAS